MKSVDVDVHLLFDAHAHICTAGKTRYPRPQLCRTARSEVDARRRTWRMSFIFLHIHLDVTAPRSYARIPSLSFSLCCNHLPYVGHTPSSKLLPHLLASLLARWRASAPVACGTSGTICCFSLGRREASFSTMITAGTPCVRDVVAHEPNRSLRDEPQRKVARHSTKVYDNCKNFCHHFKLHALRSCIELSHMIASSNWITTHAKRPGRPPACVLPSPRT